MCLRSGICGALRQGVCCLNMLKIYLTCQSYILMGKIFQISAAVFRQCQYASRFQARLLSILAQAKELWVQIAFLSQPFEMVIVKISDAAQISSLNFNTTKYCLFLELFSILARINQKFQQAALSCFSGVFLNSCLSLMTQASHIFAILLFQTLVL